MVRRVAVLVLLAVLWPFSVRAAYVTPTSRSTGFVVSAARWNQDVVDNMIAVRTAVLDSVVNVTAATDMTITATGDEVVLGDALRILSTGTDPANVGGLTYDTDVKAPTLKTDAGLYRLVGCLSSTTADSSSIANTTTPTNFSQTFDIPANSLTAGKVIRVTYHLLYSVTGTPTFQLRQLLDSTMIADSGSGVATGPGTTNQPIRVVSEIICRSVGGSGTVVVETHASWRNSNGISAIGSTGPVTVDTTQPLTINLEWTWSAASASNTVKIQGMMVEGL